MVGISNFKTKWCVSNSIILMIAEYIQLLGLFALLCQLLLVFFFSQSCLGFYIGVVSYAFVLTCLHLNKHC